MIAANIMTTRVRTLTPGSTLSDAIRLAAEAPALIPVVGEDNRVLGVIRPRALLRDALPERNPPDANSSLFIKGLERLRTQSIDKPIYGGYSSVLPHARLSDIAAIFANSVAPECVLVVDDRERLLGIISPCDILKRLLEYLEK